MVVTPSLQYGSGDMVSTTYEKNIQIEVPIEAKYLDMFIRLRSAPELIGLFPDAKEITETVGIFQALKNIQGIYKEIPSWDVVCLVPGDGALPRTGAYVALLTHWTVYSVDPLLRDTITINKELNGTFINGLIYRRLYCLKQKIEDIDQIEARIGIILAVHSHADLNDAWSKLNVTERKVTVALECCRKQEIKGFEPRKRFRDIGIFSPQNEIIIYDTEEWIER